MKKIKKVFLGRTYNCSLIEKAKAIQKKSALAFYLLVKYIQFNSVAIEITVPYFK
ncbi:hypothetical protein G15_0910 [Enterococcus avium]|nr:hypothetical protein G15_0910 [Enterococcus avium]